MSVTAAPCHHDRGKLTTHYKYITAEKKVLLCRIEIVTCMNKNKYAEIVQRIGLQDKKSLSQEAKPHD